ncbi:MAG TPA: hypothetical protein VFG42_26870 [Baekduia sp.]|uniref:hypothetical protein n=1 Tax=Baekduia sp. TaxID=2600305 RepID=UPI002D767377|nr:hypothetical protein [Baekduia sp.]HET6510447.1 hypothetical protein [Baekduia sp.]
MPDLDAAAQFVHSNGRLLERRRFEHLFVAPDPDGVLRAVEAYKNPDGGVGALEPDLRTPASQPSAVLYAFEALESVAADRPHQVAAFGADALDWIASIAHPDGGIPFVTPGAAGYAHAPWWAPVEDPPSSLLMTAGVVAAAHRLGLDHPWMAKATSYVWGAMAELKLSDAYAFRYTVHFLDAVPDRARADAEIERLAGRMPEDGRLVVEGGVEGETLSALAVAPRPDHAGVRLFPRALIDAQLDELAAAQQDDGGWTFDWAAWNPAAAFEWRGVVTLDALATLRAYSRIG